MSSLRVIGMVAVVFLLAIAGCGRQETIKIKGSDTMVNLGQAWAEAYMEKHPEASISVTGGGSGVGIAALISGDADITQSSRGMKPEEIEEAKMRGRDPKEFIVARDGLSVIVNPKNPVGRLTIGQLSDIYTGKLTNWKQLGGKDAPIVALSRDRSSGTHVFFLEHVVRKGNAKGPEEYGKKCLMQISSQSIADEVSRNENAIGYVGMGYVKHGSHKTILVAKDEKSPYIEPTTENVLKGTYPIARPLYLYTPKEPSGTVKGYIDFVLSDEGQKIVADQEFVPVRRVS